MVSVFIWLFCVYFKSFLINTVIYMIIDHQVTWQMTNPGIINCSWCSTTKKHTLESVNNKEPRETRNRGEHLCGSCRSIPAQTIRGPDDEGKSEATRRTGREIYAARYWYFDPLSQLVLCSRRENQRSFVRARCIIHIFLIYSGWISN